ncbi:hypothetical protein [Streptococcus uberis]|uniref:hypothetical protein n=1 Tax=Streptococcus uberis TaxID=1349 RepID=UPI001FF4C982|nr:hypothetical protein [Streptococcus uberis]MCK1226204.1 hypothetical protein [Streptococcus uberis]
MRKDTKMNVHVTKSGYKYYTPRQTTSKAPQAPKANKWKKGLKWLGQALLAGLKNLPGLIMKAAVLMVTTPLMILLFIFNLLKSLLVTAIGWVFFKFLVVMAYAAFWTFYAWVTNNSSSEFSFVDSQMNWLMTNFFFPHGVPIHYWWETTIIVVLAIITALSLTFYSNEA